MKIIVLGAGVTGVTAAYQLARRGVRVTLVERRSQPATGCSYANGGQLSISHPEPWASPDLWGKLPAWLLDAGAPLRFHPNADPEMWRWLLQFLRNCTAGRRARSTRSIARLAIYSQAVLATLREETGIDYLAHRDGTLHLFGKDSELEQALPLAERRRELGIEQQVLDVDGCIAVEPALTEAAGSLAGGIYAPGDEAGDVRLFTQGLATHCERLGVELKLATAVTGLDCRGGRIHGVRTADGDLAADAVVVALGTQTSALLRPLGIRVPIYPVKGYSVSLPLDDGMPAPRVNLTHESERIVTSRLGDELRIAGKAVIGGHAGLDAGALGVLRPALRLLPGLAGFRRACYWAGQRPMTPDGVPLVGATRIPNLFLDSGHGSLGWTLACGSAALLADLVTGSAPAIDHAPYAPA